MQRSAPVAILAAGGLAGVLDITAACTLWALRGVSPVRILQAIASGVLGADAFAGGWRTAALGLALHFFIAVTAATAFYLGSRFLPFLLERPLISGAAYGIAVYLFMNYAVIPLSAMKPSSPTWFLTAAQIAIHIACVGLPIALVFRWLKPGAPKAMP